MNAPTPFSKCSLCNQPHPLGQPCGMTPTPLTDANESITCKEGDPCIAPDFARQLERDIHDLNDRLIDRQKTLMETLIENQNLKRELAKANQ